MPGTGSRNIALLLAVWLRRMGVVVVEYGGQVPTALVVTQTSPRTYRYEPNYVFVPTEGVLCLVLNGGPQAYGVPLDGATVEHQAHKARYLLLRCVRYTFDRKTTRAAGANPHAIDTLCVVGWGTGVVRLSTTSCTLKRPRANCVSRCACEVGTAKAVPAGMVDTARMK